MKTITLAFLANFFLFASVFAQSGVNLLHHDIDSPPNIFIKESSSNSNENSREILSTDTVINGEEVKIRSYNIQKIHSTMMVTCYYFLKDGKWICKMAKYYSIYQPRENGIGYLGPNTIGSCVTLLNLTKDGNNLNEFTNFNGVVVTGNPPWASCCDQTREHLYQVELLESEVSAPLDGINRAFAFMNGVQSNKTQASSNTKDSDVNGFLGLFN
jgi:hypothetical protein